MSTRAGYPCDLTDDQWAVLQPHIPVNGGVGRPTEVDLRRAVGATLSPNRTGCQWRYLPTDFPPESTVSYSFSTWRRGGLSARLHDPPAGRPREPEGPEHSAGSDSQTVKSAGAGGPSGDDPATATAGRKRHVAVDRLGMILAVPVTAADVPDAVAAGQSVSGLDRGRYPGLHTLIVDGGYDRHDFPGWSRAEGDDIEIVNRPFGVRGWVTPPRRWVVERTLAWLDRSRRRCRAYERTAESEEALVRLRMIHLMLKRIAPGPPMPPFGCRPNQY